MIRELRAISFITTLIQDGKVDMKEMLIHSIGSDQTMTALGVSSKFNADWDFLCYLRTQGRDQAEHWLAQNYSAIGERCSVDLRKEVL
ncbi:hypothetical protein D9M68_331260 [compost metagenome]